MRILITGGAGFVGANLAARGIRLGHEVVVLDNLSRRGTRWNLEWLRSLGPFDFVPADVRDAAALLDLLGARRFDAVFHQAAQVAVTTSVEDPRADFEVNALGTLNVLEAIRLTRQDPVVVFSSTNKVYGALAHLQVAQHDGRYVLPAAPQGVPETAPLDFHSPYGCSKGAADQYVLDYRRIYGLRTIVFRQSCIYGPRQMGVEDQGWVAWFAICATLGRPITIYGDGRQVRDVLYVDDLVDLYYRVVDEEPRLASTVFNVGGGPAQAVSLLEVIGMLEDALGRRLALRFADWRPGDQRVYVSDIGAVRRALAWSPRVSVREGLAALLAWVREHRAVFAGIGAP